MIGAAVTRAAGLTAAAAVAATVAALPAPALGAGGTATLALNGPAAKTLRAEGVRVVPVRPAKGGAKRVVMPVGGSLAGRRTTVLRQRGALLLRRKGRELRLGELELRLGKRGRVEAAAGRRDLVLFRVLAGGRREIDPASGRVLLSRLRLKLTGAARRLIAKRLRLRTSREQARQLTGEKLGVLAARVSGDSGSAGGGGAEGGGENRIESCPLPSGAGPEPEDPLPVKARPAAAVDVTGAMLDWHVRESFVRYVETGEGTSVAGGATASGPVVLPGTSAAAVYDFQFPFASGWLDRGASAADPGDDSGAIRFGGAVRFLYSGHEIDLTAADPEIEIAGGASRAIFSVTDSGGPAERQVLINLDLSQAGAIVADGNSYTYERVPGVVPAGTAASTFAGFYAPGTEFGCVNVAFTTAG
ncbi:MAG: HtaA domain-containing protein [Solirubrobacterales bacterium]